MSDNQTFLVDAAHSVRPADVPRAALDALLGSLDAQHRGYSLMSQMRVEGADYISYVRAALTSRPPTARSFPGYDLRMFDDFRAMRRPLRSREREHGLARLLAGYAWPWRSRMDPSARNVEIDGVGLFWNRRAVDWVSSATSVDEVGSIHTIQGYDLNYPGVIIGADLGWDSGRQRPTVNSARTTSTRRARRATGPWHHLHRRRPPAVRHQYLRCAIDSGYPGNLRLRLRPAAARPIASADRIVGTAVGTSGHRPVAR